MTPVIQVQNMGGREACNKKTLVRHIATKVLKLAKPTTKNIYIPFGFNTGLIMIQLLLLIFNTFYLEHGGYGV